MSTNGGPDTAPGSGWRRLIDELPAPLDPADRDDLLWQELDAHFRWYQQAARRTRIGYQSLRLLVLAVGATVTVLAAVRAPAAVTASLAAVIVVAEGAQQLFQLHANWIRYRSCAETLRRHAFLYAAGAPPYSGPGRRDALAQVLLDVTNGETRQWAAHMSQPSHP
jgi:hypothetical protein